MTEPITYEGIDLTPLLGARPGVAWNRKIHFISVFAGGILLIETKEYHLFHYWLQRQGSDFMLIGKTHESILRNVRKFSPEEFFQKLVPTSEQIFAPRRMAS